MPPKGKRPSGPTDAFLFVNEDFSTLFGGAKNADLDRTKQSHVQRRSFAKRRKIQRGGTTSSASSTTQSEDAHSPAPRAPLLPFPPSNSLWLPTTQEENVTNTQADTHHFSPFDDSTLSLWPSATDSLLQHTPYELAQLEQHLMGQPQEPRLTLPPLPGPLMSTELSIESESFVLRHSRGSLLSTDPFDNISVALEQWAPPLMRYFTTKMVPEFFYTDLQATSLHHMRHVEYIHQDMRSCMSSPAEMYALLAASACHALSREGRLELPGLASEDSDRVTLLFKSKAFESLRLRLSSGDLTHGVVIAIQRMICAALYTSSCSALESHYRAWLSMIQTIGGLETFNDFQKERLIMHDFQNALSTGCSPRLELAWDPGEFATDARLEFVFHVNRQKTETGGRLRSITEGSETDLDPAVARCVSDLVETQQVLEWLRDALYQPGHYRWLSHRRLAIMHRLLTMNASSMAGVSKLVRYALLYYCAMVRAIPLSNCGLIDHYVIRELAEWDQEMVTDVFRPHTDLLLWVTMILALGIRRLEHNTTAAKSPSEHSKSQGESSRRSPRDVRNFDADTFLAEIGKRACQKLNLTEEVQLRDLMKSFLFDGDFVDEKYMTFVQEGLKLSK